MSDPNEDANEVHMSTEDGNPPNAKVARMSTSFEMPPSEEDPIDSTPPSATSNTVGFLIYILCCSFTWYLSIMPILIGNDPRYINYSCWDGHNYCTYNEARITRFGKCEIHPNYKLYHFHINASRNKSQSHRGKVYHGASSPSIQ